MNSVIRRWFLPIHRWAGLTIGLVLAWMALTGAGMAFRAQLAPQLDRDLLVAPICIEPLPIDTLADAARAAHPGVPLAHVRIQPRSEASALLRFADNATYYLDPCSGLVLGEQHKYGGVFGRLEQWHRLKFLKSGSLIIGGSVLVAIVILLLGGALLWWSSRKSAAATSARIGTALPARARNLRRHRTVGIYACIVLLASAMTGLPKSFTWYRDAVFAVAGSAPNPPPPRSSSVDGTASPISLEEGWRRAQATVGEVAEARIHLPPKGSGVMEIELVESSAPHAEAHTLVFLDAHSGEILELRPYATTSVGNKLLGWMLAWHKGQLGGVFGPLVLFAGTISLLFLAYTGIGSYLRRRASRGNVFRNRA